MTQQPSHQQLTKRGGDRPQAVGRVFSLSREDASRLGNLILGECLVAGRCLSVLFEYGAIHSFVSTLCVQELELPVKELQFKMLVSTLASSSISTCPVCVLSV